MVAIPKSLAVASLRSEAEIVGDLLRLQRAAQQINSVLNLDLLLEQVAHEVAQLFGCLETSVWLCDGGRGEMVLAGVRGCTLHRKGARLKIGKEGMVGWVAAHLRTRYAPDVTRESTTSAAKNTPGPRWSSRWSWAAS